MKRQVSGCKCFCWVVLMQFTGSLVSCSVYVTLRPPRHSPKFRPKFDAVGTRSLGYVGMPCKAVRLLVKNSAGQLTFVIVSACILLYVSMHRTQTGIMVRTSCTRQWTTFEDG